MSKVTGYQHHPLILRVTHWINAAAMIVMIGSGWRIYNWHPALPVDFIFPPVVSLGGDPVLSQPIHTEDGLASALMWHFGAMWVLVANLLVYLGYGIFSGHFRRDFLPLSPRAFLRDFMDAARGRLAHRLGEYNAVQRVFYWGVLAAMAVTILSGLGIWKPVQFQALTALFGGYEAARVVHFLGMTAIVAFLAVHLALALLVPQTIKAMITGHAGTKEVQS